MFATRFVALCSLAAAFPAAANLLVTTQSGQIQAIGQTGPVTASAPTNSPWQQQLISGDPSSQWTGIAFVDSSWNDQEIRINTTADVLPGQPQPFWTRALVDTAIDFNIAQTTDVQYATIFGFSISPPLQEDVAQVQLLNLTTGEQVSPSGTFDPITLFPGSYRLRVNLRLGNLEASPESFQVTTRAASAILIVVPTPTSASCLLAGLCLFTRARRR